MSSRGFPPNEISKLEQRLKLIDSGLSKGQITDRSRQQDTTLTPHLLELKARDLFDLQDRKFTLPSNINWQLPESIFLANGNNRLRADVREC